jgi:hypothetical protein
MPPIRRLISLRCLLCPLRLPPAAKGANASAAALFCPCEITSLFAWKGWVLDAAHRMVPTRATKTGLRYRYCVLLPHLQVCRRRHTLVRSPASRRPRLQTPSSKVSTSSSSVRRRSPLLDATPPANNRDTLPEQVARIDVHKHLLTVQLRSRTKHLKRRAAVRAPL